MVRFFVAFWIALLSALHLHAQNSSDTLGTKRLSITNVDAAAYPRIKAQVYAFTSNQIRTLSADDLTITENGHTRRVTAISCANIRPNAISAVITFDVSGSMSGDYVIDRAKTAALTLISAIPLGRSECSLTSFDDAAYVNQDFTTDRGKLFEAASKLKPQGGTYFYQGFLATLTSGLEVSKTARRRRVMFFLTDGAGDVAADSVIKAATALNVSVVCLVYAPAPEILKKIVKETGGLLFDNIRTSEEAVSTALRALAMVQGIQPCTVEWESASDCLEERSVCIGWKSNDSSAAKGFFLAPKSGRTLVEFSPPALAFDNIPPGNSKELSFTVTARHSALTIENISSQRNTGTLEISAWQNEPIHLKDGESRTFTARFTAKDSALLFASIDVRVAECGIFSLPVGGGFRNKRQRASALQLLQPNGGELYGLQQDTVIRWQGVPQTTPVTLQFSLDSGAQWTTISREGKGLQHSWHTPDYESTKALVRVSTPLISTAPALKGTFSNAETRWSNDGKMLLVHSDNVLLAVLSGTTSVLWRDSLAVRGSMAIGWQGSRSSDLVAYLREIPLAGGKKEMQCVTRFISSGTILSSVLVPATSLPTNDHAPKPLWNSSGSLVCLQTQSLLSGKYADTLSVIDPHSGRIVRSIAGAYTAQWMPGGTLLAIREKDRGNLSIIEAGSGKEEMLVPLNAAMKDSFINFRWHPKGGRLAVSVQNKLFVSDIATQDQLWALSETLGKRPKSIKIHAWSPDGKTLAAIANGNSVVLINAETGAVQREFTIPASHVVQKQVVREQPLVTDIAWHPSGQFLSVSYELRDDFTSDRLQNGEYLFSISGTRLASGRAIHWNDEGSITAVDNSGITILETGTFQELATAPDLKLGALSPDGELAAVLMPGDTVIRQVTLADLASVQTDISDAPFSLLGTTFDVEPIVAFGIVPVGVSKDSVVRSMIRNTGKTAGTISLLNVFNTDKGKAFSLIAPSLLPITLQPGQTLPVELRFHAIEKGINAGALLMKTSERIALQTTYDSLFARWNTLYGAQKQSSEQIAFPYNALAVLHGIGAQPRARLLTTFIDMGNVDVGASKDTVVSLIQLLAGDSLRIRSIESMGPATAAFAPLPTTPQPLEIATSPYSFRFRFSPPDVGRFSNAYRFTVDTHDTEASTTNPSDSAARMETLTVNIFGRGAGELPPLEPEFPAFSDPTTFRSILFPNAVIPKRGSIFGGIVGGLGLQAGYSVSDNLMLTALLVPPLPSDSVTSATQFRGAYSFGVKAGFQPFPLLDLALGYQFVQATFERGALSSANYNRRLTAHLPYTAVSYGTDDMRVSLAGGYLARLQALSLEDFTAQEPGVVLGADYRFAREWKVAGEVVFSPSLGVLPIVLTARYLHPIFTIEAGAAFVGLKTANSSPFDTLPIPFLPVINILARW